MINKPNFPGDRYFIRAKRWSVNPGILFGGNIKLANDFFIEMFGGLKGRFVKEEKIFNDNTMDKKDFTKMGLRLGISLAKNFY